MIDILNQNTEKFGHICIFTCIKTSNIHVCEISTNKHLLFEHNIILVLHRFD